MSRKKLGFGLMRLPLTDANNDSTIDIEQTKQMVDLFLERGFTYFDTAWMYCGFNSENAVRGSPCFPLSQRPFHPDNQIACRLFKNKGRPGQNF